MQKLYRKLAGLLIVGVMCLQGLVLYIQDSLPDYFYVAQGQQLQIPSAIPIHVQMDREELPTTGESYSVRLQLPYGIVLKDAKVQVIDREMVVPLGTLFGMRISTDGVIVEELREVAGESLSPWKEAGIQVGDVIVSVNGQPVTTNGEIGEILSGQKGQALRLTLKRKEETKTATVQPLKGEDGDYHTGIMTKDYLSNIGTMTYYHPSTNVFAALGHGVSNKETGGMVPLREGEIGEVSLRYIEKGEKGSPGKLGAGLTGQPTGELMLNTPVGVFGVGTKPYYPAKAVPMGFPYEVEEGEATMLCSVENGEVQAYSILIEQVNVLNKNPAKNMIVRIIDKELLAQTGGIVQGMSGSPILQNGKLIGAVTHVFVDDPTRGYGVFIHTMEQMCRKVEEMAA